MKEINTTYTHDDLEKLRGGLIEIADEYKPQIEAIATKAIEKTRILMRDLKIPAHIDCNSEGTAYQSTIESIFVLKFLTESLAFPINFMTVWGVKKYKNNSIPYESNK